MVTDAPALPEQVADDAVLSASRSAGQRCSALRLLCVQADVADKVIAMIAGAASELRLGDPADPATHIGPVIDAEAKELGHHLREGCKALPDPKPLDQFGYVFSEMTDEIAAQRDGFAAYLESFEGAH